MEIKQSFPNLTKALNDYGNNVIQEVTALLEKDGRKASGNLINSLKFRIVDEGDKFVVYLDSADYFKQINDGRPPTTNGGDGEVRQKILEWIKKKGIQPQQSQDRLGRYYKPTQEQLSFLIARKIHTWGYDGGDYLNRVLNAVQAPWIEKFQSALLRDFDEEVMTQIVAEIKKIRI